MSSISTTGLTREEVSYLKRANDVYAIRIDGVNYLRCIKRNYGDDRFTPDITVDIPVGGNGADGWFTSAYSFPWETLRTGDEVSLYWFPDANTNENLRDVGLHADTLYVDITRGKKSARYMASVSVCPENSARMCRTATYSI